MVDSSILVGELDSLNSKSIPKLDDVKLVNLLWNSASDPDKESRLIKWLTLTLGIHDTISNEVKQALWKTLMESLSSPELQRYFDLHGKEIEIKSIFTDRLIQEVSSISINSDLLFKLLNVSEALLFNKKLFSEFGFKFQTMTKLAGAWILFVKRFVEDESNAEEHLFILAKFLEKLIGKLSKAVKEARIKNAPIFLIKFFMTPALEFCIKIYHQKSYFDCFQKVYDSTSHVFKTILFSRATFCSKEYVCHSDALLEEGQNSSSDTGPKKAFNVTDAFFSKLQEWVSENVENRSSLAMAYQIFLQSCLSSNTKHEKKIMFFLSSVNILKSGQPETCLDVYLKLFELTVSNSLHKRAIEESLKQRLETFYSDFTIFLLDLNFTPTVQECLLLVAQCSQSAVENRISLIMESLFRVAQSKEGMDYSWVQKFFNNLFRTFHSIRKPLSLFEKVVDSLMEECARNITSSNRHCIVLCGAVGRALSSQSSSSVHPGLAIDLWEGLQAKARELIPDIEADSGEVDQIEPGRLSPVNIGKKRKASDVSKMLKKPKLDSSFTSIFHCLLILINSIMEQVEFVEATSGSLQLRWKKINRLLKEISNLLKILRHDLALNEANELMGQYYQLLATLGHRELLMKKYAVGGPGHTVVFNLNDLEKWEVKPGSDYSSMYRFKQWQCFRIQLEATKVLGLSQTQMQQKPEFHEALSALLSTSSEPSTSGTAVWDRLPETIATGEILDIATLTLLQSFLPVVLSLSSDQCLSAFVDLLLRNFNTSQKLTLGHISGSSIARDIFENPVLIESRRFHEAFVKTMLKNIRSTAKGKKNKAFKSLLKYAKSICASSDVTDDVTLSQTIVKLFQKPLVDEVVKASLKKALSALFLLPYHFFSTNQTFAIVTLIVCCLSNRDDDNSFQHQCLAAIDAIIDASNASKFNKFFPRSVFLPYFTLRSGSYKHNCQSSIRRLLLTPNNLELGFQDSLYDLNNISIASFCCQIPKQLNVDDGSIVTALWILEIGCETMRGILRGFVLQCADDDSFASVLPLCDEEALEEVTNDRALSDGKLSVLSHWAKALRQTIKVATSYLKHVDFSSVSSRDLDLFERVIVASSYVESCPGQKSNCQTKLLKKLSNLNDWLCNVTNDLKKKCNTDVFQPKMQLVHVAFDLVRSAQRKQTELLPFSKNMTSSTFAFNLISLYTSSMTQQSDLNRSLLDRAVVKQHLLLSREQYKNCFSSCRENLIFSDDFDELCAYVMYARAICVNYYKVIRPTFRAMIKDSDLIELLHQLHLGFFTDVFFDLTRLVNRLTSSDQAQLPTLRETFNAINDMLKIKEVIPGRLAISAFPSIQRIDLCRLYSDKQFSSEFPRFFALHCDFASLILFHSSNLLQNIVPLILSMYRKLVKACVDAARKNADNENFEVAKQCAFQLEKLFHSVATHHKSAFGKFASFLVADYLTMLSTVHLFPSILNKLDTAMFYIFSICNEADYKFINSNLSENLRPLFHTFFQTYNKKFKYTGWV